MKPETKQKLIEACPTKVVMDVDVKKGCYVTSGLYSSLRVAGYVVDVKKRFCWHTKQGVDAPVGIVVDIVNSQNTVSSNYDFFIPLDQWDEFCGVVQEAIDKYVEAQKQLLVKNEDEKEGDV
jgi:hypothetical protein